MTKAKRMVARALGMGEFVDRLESGKCPFCGSDMKGAKFSDEKSEREFKISGLCQACQERTQADFEAMARAEE